MSVYRGPLLLAYDVLLNDNAPAGPRTVHAVRSAEGKDLVPVAGTRTRPASAASALADRRCAAGGRHRRCDYATLPRPAHEAVTTCPGCRPIRSLRRRRCPTDPDEAAAVPPGRLLFRAAPPGSRLERQRLRLLIADNPDMHNPLVDVPCEQPRSIVVPEEQTRQLKPNLAYYWRLVGREPLGQHAQSGNLHGNSPIDPRFRPCTDDMLTEYGENADGVIVQAGLQGNPTRRTARWCRLPAGKPRAGPDGTPDQAVELNGTDGMLVYQLRAFPQTEYTVVAPVLGAARGRAPGTGVQRLVPRHGRSAADLRVRRQALRAH